MTQIENRHMQNKIEAIFPTFKKSIVFEFPVTLIGLRVLPRGAPVPGNLDTRSRTEPPNFQFDIFCIDSKTAEPVKLLYVGGGKYSIEKSINDFQVTLIFSGKRVINSPDLAFESVKDTQKSQIEVRFLTRKWFLPDLDSSFLRAVFRVDSEYLPLLMIQ